MAAVPEAFLSSLDLIASVVITVLTAGAAFVGGLWYLSLDRKTENYDDQLQEDIEEEAAFSGIQEAAERDFIATSDSSISKVTTHIEKVTGGWSENPDKIVIVSGDTFTGRKIEMIRERCREIPGKTILSSELVAAIRNHYAFKLALAREDVNSEVVEHFRSKFEEYEHSGRVSELSKPENYENVIVLNDPGLDGQPDPLNDVFLRIVKAAERHCVRPISNLTEKSQEMERCRSLLMLTFFGLYAQSMKGAENHNELSEEECLNGFRTSIRDEDNWGYWLLPNGDCSEEEFKRIMHMCWRIGKILDEYWDDEDYSELYPHAASIKELEYVAEPFIVYQKDEEQFRGGGPGGQQ